MNAARDYAEQRLERPVHDPRSCRVSDTVEWRWVDIDGEQHVVGFTELADALSVGALPPFVLVWRTGWLEWLAAENSPELAYALGMDRSGPPSFQRPNPDQSAPPAPPLERYAASRPSGAVTLRNPRLAERTSTVPPGRPDLKPPRPPVPGIPPPPAFMGGPVPIRDVMPTLADDEPVRSPTLRPAGALPPPPRAIPQSKIPVFEDVLDPSEAPPAVAPPHAAPRPPLPRPPASPPPVAPAQRSIPALEARKSPPVASPVASPAPALAAARGRSGGAARQGASSKAGGLSRQTITTLTSVGLVLPGALLLTLALMRPSKKGVREPEAASSSVAGAASARAPSPPPEPPGCRQNGPSRRLSASAYVGVPVLVTTTPDRGQIAVGFASAKDHALGITVNPTTLVVAPAFEETVADSATLGVVPLVRGGALAFAVDRADPTLSFARTVDAPKPFSIGVGSEGFSRKVGDVISVIWPGKSKNPTITTPRVAALAGTGHAVAFRHGGQEGKVLVGWLKDDGQKLTELKAVATESTLVGTPTLSASDGSVLVAFAGKVAADQGFRVELATAAHGALPERAKVFELPAGGPSGEAISPSSEGLPGGRFLLQWTEGSAGNRAVRAQMLSADLVPVGDAITVSTPEQNAGQGALWVHGDEAVALYLVKTETSHELWGASLKCR
jgi:hypothetical protein